MRPSSSTPSGGAPIWDTRGFAEQALAENPDDFETLLTWTQLQIDSTKREAGYRKLYAMNPTSYEVLMGLANRVEGTAESLALGKKMTALPTFESQPPAEKWLVSQLISRHYESLGDKESALAYHKKAYVSYTSNIWYPFQLVRSAFSPEEVKVFLEPLGVDPLVLKIITDDIARYQKREAR